MRASARLLAAAAAAAAAAASSSPLYDALSASHFLHVGTVRAGDTYGYLPISCGYLEPENVTAAQSSWGQGGTCRYLYAFNGVSSPRALGVERRRRPRAPTDPLAPRRQHAGGGPPRASLAAAGALRDV